MELFVPYTLQQCMVLCDHLLEVVALMRAADDLDRCQMKQIHDYALEEAQLVAVSVVEAVMAAAEIVG